MEVQILVKKNWTEKAIIADRQGNPEYLEVAIVQAEGLEDAFLRTQNLVCSWVENPGVVLNKENLIEHEGELVMRSTMMGDRFVMDGKTYEADFVGFTEVA
jgi:hypothetical protein